MMYIGYSDLIHLINESLYPLTNICPFLPPPSPWQPPFYSLVLRIQLKNFFLDSTYK